MYFAAGVDQSEVQNPITPPPLYTLYTCIQQYTCTCSHREGGRVGGGEFNQREGEGGNSSQS